MPPDADEPSVAEGIVNWVFLAIFLAGHIFLPPFLSLSDNLQWHPPRPTWWPAWRCWPSPRSFIVFIWAVWSVAGTILCILTVTLWRTGRPKHASRCLFALKAFTTSELTVAEVCSVIRSMSWTNRLQILQVLHPANHAFTKRLLADDKKGPGFSWYFPSSLGVHAIWLTAGAWKSDLEFLAAMPMLTHICSAVPVIYVMVKSDELRLRWWSAAICCAGLISCAALLATISGWRTGHHSLQCACSHAMLLERAVWTWRVRPSHRMHGQRPQSDDGGDSVHSTTKLVDASQ